jgi:hypothetical protein
MDLAMTTQTHTPFTIGAVDAAMSEIRLFAGQMQQMTDLFGQAQIAMMRQIDAAHLRMERAAETVASAQARISAQVAAFERMTKDARRAGEDHARSLNETFERLQVAAGDIEKNATAALRRETEAVTSRIASLNIGLDKAAARIDEASQGFERDVTASVRREAAALGNSLMMLQGGLGGVAERMSRDADRLLQDIGGRVMAAVELPLAGLETRLGCVFAESEARADNASAVLNQAASVLAASLQKELSAQDAHAGVLANLVAELNAAAAAVASAKPAPAEMDPLVQQRVDAAAAAVMDAAHLVTTAVSGLQAQTPREDAEHLATTLRNQIDAGISRLDQSLAQAAASDRSSQTTDMLSQLQAQTASQFEMLREALTPKPVERPVPSAELDVEREALKRLTVGTRMMMKEAGEQTMRLQDLTAVVSGAIQQLDATAKTLAETAAAPPAALEPVRIESLPPFPDIPPASEFQRMLVAFKLVLQNINGESERLADFISKLPPLPALAAPVATDLSPVISRIETATVEMVQRIDAAAASILEAVPASQPEKPVSELPMFSEERDSVQRMLAGFRLLLKDIQLETENFRSRIADIRQPETLVLSPAVDAELLAPLSARADQMAAGLAEQLALMEQRLSAPVTHLDELTSGAAKLLRGLHKQMAEPAKMSAPATPVMRVPEAVAAMERAALIIDQRLAQAGDLTAALRRGGAVSGDALKATATSMTEAVDALRGEAGVFLSVAAALSRDLETAGGQQSPDALDKLLKKDMKKQPRRRIV